jgi:hypothetical protein
MSLNDYAPAAREYEADQAKAHVSQINANALIDASRITFPPKIDYCFTEDEYLLELKEYIDKTYGQHYAKSKIQSTEFIMDAGHGEGFCIGNIIKYAQRYGKKAGKNRADLLKVCHYAIMMLHVHDRFNSQEKE